MSLIAEQKTSVMADLMANTKAKGLALTDTISNAFTSVGKSTTSGTTSTTSSWLMPVLILGAVALAVWKFFPKVFTKGRGRRTATRRR